MNKKIAIDLDKTLGTCKSRVYSFLAKSGLAKNNAKKKKYYEVPKDPILKCTFLNKVIKLLNPKKYTIYPDAVETIKELKKAGYQIYLVSSRPTLKPIIAMTQNWLKQNGVEYDKLIMGCKNKAIYAKDENIDFFIDDLRDNCVEFLKTGVQALHFGQETQKEKHSVVKQPDAKTETPTAKRPDKKQPKKKMDLPRVANWKGVKEYFGRLERNTSLSKVDYTR